MFAMVRVLVLCIAFGSFACKKKPPEDPAPPAATAPAAATPDPTPSETVDALNPPPPAPLPDLATATDTASAKRPQIDNANAEAQRRVQTCLDGIPASALQGGALRLAVKYTIGGDGKAHDVTVDGVPPDAIACSKSAIEGVAFPTFNGPGAAQSFSLTYSRPQPSQPDAKPATP